MNVSKMESQGAVDVCIIHVEQDSGEVTVHGRPKKIQPTDVKRSDVIKNVCSAGGGVVPLPISYDQFQSWLDFANSGKASVQEVQPAHLTNILLVRLFLQSTATHLIHNSTPRVGRRKIRLAVSMRPCTSRTETIVCASVFAHPSVEQAYMSTLMSGDSAIL